MLGIIAEAICAAISFIRRQNKQQSALFLLSKLERSSNSSLAAEGQPAVMAQIPRHQSRDYTQTSHGSSVRIVKASGPAGLTVPREDQLEEAFKRKRAKYKKLIEICQNRVLRAHCLAKCQGLARHSLHEATELLKRAIRNMLLLLKSTESAKTAVKQKEQPVGQHKFPRHNLRTDHPGEGV